MSHSILRRYTPPTCTLEIMANSSPLSRWMGQPVLKDLRWRLKLDDPKVTAEEWTVIQGDRPQLEALRETVQTYVQNLLDHSQSRLDEALNPAAVATTPAPTAEDTAPAAPDRAGIVLHPHGLLAHDLTLGTLATATSGQTIALSTLQLFDLANALDEYTTDLITLPDLTPASGIKTAPAWTKMAATAVVAIGVAASAAKLFEQTPKTASAPSSSDQRIASQLPPNVVSPNSPPALSNQPLGMPPLLRSPMPANQNPALPSLSVPKAGAGTGQPGTPLDSKSVPGNPAVIVPKPSVTIANEGSPAATTGRSAPPAPPAKLNPDELAAASEAALSGNIATAPARSSQDNAVDLGQANTRNRAAESKVATIPQLDELKQYFQKRWKPIAGVTEPLQYQLELGANGAIQRTTPLGKAAQDHVEESTISLNEVIVAPLTQGKAATIRLVLRPDGTVETFLEKIME
jgi:hypothetical protein